MNHTSLASFNPKGVKYVKQGVYSILIPRAIRHTHKKVCGEICYKHFTPSG